MILAYVMHLILQNGNTNRAQRINPWSPLHGKPTPGATARSSARRAGRYRAVADAGSIPPRMNAGSTVKADETGNDDSKII